MSTKKETLTATRSNAEERLVRNVFYLESSFCKAGGQGGWPPQWLLKEIKDDVLVLDGLRHVKRVWPDWEAFVRVHKENKKLQLETRVNALIHRALAILPRESVLSKTVVAALRGNAKAQRSLRDMVLKAGNPAELFWEYRQMVQQQCKAEPLVCWLAEIHHPMAKDFGVAIFVRVEKGVKILVTEKLKEERRREHKRDANRERKRLFDLRKRQKNLS